MSPSPDSDLVRCSPTEGCGELKPRRRMVRWGTSSPLCMACYQRARRLDQDPAEIRRANLWAKYRSTPEQYDALRADQNYCCGICGVHEADVDLNRVGGRPAFGTSHASPLRCANYHHSINRIRCARLQRGVLPPAGRCTSFPLCMARYQRARALPRIRRISGARLRGPSTEYLEQHAALRAVSTIAVGAEGSAKRRTATSLAS